jgi:hypothetical protein
MKYSKMINAWGKNVNFKKMQVGQWVSAGQPDTDRSNCGRFYGVSRSGSITVAWNGNARRHSKGFTDYQHTIHKYAKGVRA